MTSASTNPSTDAADDSFIQHPKYFFKDGNLTFLVCGVCLDSSVHTKVTGFIGLQVDGTLYCVHQFFFSRDSVYFSARFDQLGDREALPIISLGNIKCKDFDAFLSILYPEYVFWSIVHQCNH
jgi:hypothetical protein